MRWITTLDELKEASRKSLNYIPHVPTGQKLLELGVVSPEQLDLALTYQALHPDKRLGKILMDQGVLQKDDLMISLADGIPKVDLSRIPLDKDLLRKAPPEFLIAQVALPICLVSGRIIVAVSDVADAEKPTTLSFIFGAPVDIVFAAEKDILENLRRFLEVSKQEDDLDRLGITERMSGSDETRVWREAERLAHETPVVRLVSSIIHEAAFRRASDIHIRPDQDGVDVLYRIDGTLMKQRELKKSVLPAVLSRIKILSNLNIAEHRLPQGGRTEVEGHDGKPVDLRVSIIPCQFGESVSIRLLDRNQGVRRMEDLGLDHAGFLGLRRALKKDSGLVLVTGQTGSGKTTTLYAALQELVEDGGNIITVEDPVEFTFPKMRQIQILPAVGFGFSQALRHILRHDPDVIMVGEIRDLETCKMAVESALTGHLVLSTLHTNSAPETVLRLVEMGVEPYLVRSALAGVLAQRLARKNCVHCSEPEEIAEEFQEEWLACGLQESWHSQGCDKCYGTGFMGRVGLYEWLSCDGAIRSEIHSGLDAESIYEVARRHGMVTMHENGLAKVKSGELSFAELSRIVRF